MKKLFQLPFLAMACMIMFGCTSDYEFEDEQSLKEKKALEIKAKILELAEDYGMNVKFNGVFSPEEVDSIDLNKVEAVFRAISNSSGSYEMLCRKTREGNIEATQVTDKKKRVKRMSRAQETYEFYECNFADETGNDEQFVYTSEGLFICTCRASWSTDGDIAKTAYISPNVILKDPIVYDYDIVNCDYIWHHIGGSFYGTIKVEVRLTFHISAYVDIDFTGNCDPTGGSITWN